MSCKDLEVSPVVLIDSREQTPLLFDHFAFQFGTLQTGDYSFLGAQELFSIERKTIADLVQCCTGDNRARFERELHRLRGYQFKRLLIVGTETDILDAKYRSNISPKSVLGTLNAFEVRYDVPVVFSPTPQAAALQIERWIHYFSRQLIQAYTELKRGSELAPPAALGCALIS